MNVKKSNIKETDIFPVFSQMTDVTLTAQNESFMQILNETLTPPQKRLSESFGVYLKYDVDKDFVVDLDDHWKELGYSQKGKVTDLVWKHFEANVDFSHDRGNTSNRSYSTSICEILNQPKSGLSGGRPKVKFYLTISAYKILCSLVGTDQGKEIRKYFIAVEKATLAFYKRHLELSRQRQLEFVAQLEKRESLILELSKKAENLEKRDSLIIQKDLELSKNLKKLKDAKAENLEQWYYVWKVNDNSTEGGITSNPENTLRTYRRISTDFNFYWLYKFQKPENARFIEEIIKHLLSELREKADERTEVFALDQELFKNFAHKIIKIYDSIDDSPIERVTKFIATFNSPSFNNPKIDAILEKLEKIEILTAKETPTIINNTNTAPTIIN